MSEDMIVLCCILGYVAVAWVVAFIFGRISWRNAEMDGLEVLMAVLWPITLLVLICVIAIECVSLVLGKLWRKMPHTDTLIRIARYAALPFHPYKFGQMVRDWHNGK